MIMPKLPPPTSQLLTKIFLLLIIMAVEVPDVVIFLPMQFKVTLSAFNFNTVN